MLYACVVGDSTLVDLEGKLEPFAMDDVLAEPPSEVGFTNPAEHCPRIPIETLRKRGPSTLFPTLTLMQSIAK